MSRIVRPDTAFQGTRQRAPRVQNPTHLAFIRTLPCLLCQKPPPNDAAHISMGSWELCKRDRGKGEKVDDQWTLPLCRDCHSASHDFGDEKLFWTAVGIDPFLISLRLKDLSGDEERARLVVERSGRHGGVSLDMEIL